MRRSNRLFNLALAGATSILVLSACGDRPNVPVAASPAKPASQDSQSVRRNVQLLAAAEPFETLTEQAFTAPPPELTKLHDEARRQLAAAGPALTNSDAAKLSVLSSDLQAAFAQDDRPAIAVASVESFRVLVSAQDATTAKAPIAVSLLDYAGFRFDAHLKAKPPRWNELAGDAAFTRATWAGLRPQVTSAGLADAFETALSGMEEGVSQRNISLAQYAARTELALVDLLEEHLARR